MVPGIYCGLGAAASASAVQTEQVLGLSLPGLGPLNIGRHGQHKTSLKATLPTWLVEADEANLVKPTHFDECLRSPERQIWIARGNRKSTGLQLWRRGSRLVLEFNDSQTYAT